MSDRRLVLCQCDSHCGSAGGRWIEKSAFVLHREDDLHSSTARRRFPLPAPAASPSSTRPATPSGSRQHAPAQSKESPSPYTFGPPTFDPALAKIFRTEIAELLDEPQTRPLRFAHDPSSFSVHNIASSTNLYSLEDSEQYLLASASKNNAGYFFMQSRFHTMLDTVELWPPSSERDDLADLVYAALHELDMRRVYAWADQRLPDDESYVIYTEYLYRQNLPRDTTVASAYVGILAMSALGQLDRDRGRLLLSLYRDSAAASTATSHAVPHIPKDPRHILTSINLSPACHRYACCALCSSLYPSDSGVAPPLHCTNQATPRSIPCGTLLMKETGSPPRLVPLLSYKHQDLLHWIARLLSRPGIEDIIEAEAIRLGKGDSGTRFPGIIEEDGVPFLPGPPSETRLVFAWSHDSFNPYYNKAAGVTAESTGFWLVCMSLPENIRYLEENVFFAGCFPGKPKGHQINSVLALIVNIFLKLWKGVWFSRTHKHRHGRLLKAVVVPQISDSEGLRQGAGHGGHRHKSQPRPTEGYNLVIK